MVNELLKKWTPFILDVGVRATFILLYSYTAVMKVADFAVYRIKMHRQVFPDWLTEIMIYLLPAAELAVALVLLLPFFWRHRLLRFGPSINVLLMLSFTIYAWLAKEEVFGYIPCACGGFFENMEWPVHYKVNRALTILAIGGVCLQHWPKIRLKLISLYTYLKDRMKHARDKFGRSVT